MSRYPIWLNSNDAIRLKGPTDVRDPSNPAALTGHASTSWVRIYDDEAPEMLLNGDSAEEVDTFKVLGQELMPVGTIVAVRGDDNDVFASIITAIDDDANTITLGSALDAGVKIPNRRKFWSFPGSAVYPMTEYGTPVAFSRDWGYRATVSELHTGLYHKQDVVAEIDFDAGQGLRSVIYMECVVLRQDT